MFSQQQQQHQSIRSVSHGSVSSSTSSSSSSTSSSVRSRSIPIHGGTYSSSLSRTRSEEQLCLDQAIADTRDYQFCCRVVKGISKTIERNESTSSPHWRDVNQECLNHIINTRNTNNNNECGNNDQVSRSIPSNITNGGFMMSAISDTSADSDGDDWAMGYCDIDSNVVSDNDDDEYGNFSLNRNDPITTSAINWLNANSEIDVEDVEDYEQQQDSSNSYEDEIIFDMEL